jgi:hypothetical protein
MTHSTWERKDPDEVVNYSVPWGGQLAEGATIATSNWPDPSGAVLTNPGISDDGQSTLVTVSGGTDGTTAVFTNVITTTDGETLEQLILLPIVANSTEEPEPYDTPRPQDLVERYPAFASVSYTTIAVHIRDALSGADTTWKEADYHPAVLSLAAHNMALLGLGDEGEVEGYRRAGVTSIRDGAFGVSFSDKAVGRANGGGLDATPYGRAYMVLLRRNRGGPRLVGGALGGDGWYPLAQQNNGVILP